MHDPLCDAPSGAECICSRLYMARLQGPVRYARTAHGHTAYCWCRGCSPHLYPAVTA